MKTRIFIICEYKHLLKVPIKNVLNNISFVVDEHLYLNADAYHACVSLGNSVLIDHI